MPLTEWFDCIADLISKSPDGISIHEVSEKLGVHRNTAAKYLDILHSQGVVEIRKIGVTKLYHASKKVPLSSILRLYLEPVIAVDRGRIIRSLNQPAIDLIGHSQEECAGRSLSFLEDLICPGLYEGIVPSLQGNECQVEGVRHARNRVMHYTIRAVPTLLSDGRSGSALIIYDIQSLEGLRTRLRHYDLLIDELQATIDPIIVYVTESLDIIFANEGYFQLLCSFDNAEKGKLHFEVLQQDRHILNGALSSAKQSGESTADFRVIVPSGCINHYAWIIRAKLIEDSWRFLIIGTDETDYYHQKEQFQHFFESAELIVGKRTEDLREINRQLFSEIAERKRSEEKLRMFEHTIATVADFVFWFTDDGLITYYNQSAQTSLLLPDTQKQIWVDSFFLHPPLGSWDCFYQELKNKGSIVLETSMIRSDGITLSVEIRVTRISYGGIEYCCCVARDLQERLTGLENLVVSENRFRELAETISDVVYVRDMRSGQIEYVNQAFEEIYHRSVREVYSDPELWLDAIYDDDHNRIGSRFEFPMDDRVSREYRIIRPSGEVRWVREKIHFIRDNTGTPIREIGVVSDCTHEKQILDEMREMNVRFHLALHAVPVTMFGLDLSLTYTWVENPSLGFTEKEIIGYTDDEIFPSEIARDLILAKQKIIETGEGYEMVLDIPAGGKKVPVQIYLKPCRNDRGEITGLTGAAIEIDSIIHHKRRYTVNEQRYRRFFDTIQEGFLILSPSRSKNSEVDAYHIIDLNYYLISHMNRQKKDLIGRDLFHIFPEAEFSCEKTLKRVVSSGTEQEGEFWSDFLEGYFSLKAFPAGEDLIGVIIRDITDQKRRSDHLQLYRDLAKDLSVTTDFRYALDLILKTAMEVPGIDSGGLYILQEGPPQSVLILCVHRGLSEEYLGSVREVNVDEFIHDLFEKKMPAYISLEDPISEQMRNLMILEGLRSFVFIPLFQQGHIVGCLNLGSHTLYHILEREKPFLEALSVWLGKPLARLLHEYDQDAHTGYAIIKPDGNILEGTLWPERSDAPEEIITILKRDHAVLMTGKEIRIDQNSPYQPFLIRFCPWGDDALYLIRSGGSRT